MMSLEFLGDTPDSAEQTVTLGMPAARKLGEYELLRELGRGGRLRCAPTDTPTWIGPTVSSCGGTIGETLIAALIGVGIASTYTVIGMFGWNALPFSIAIFVALFAAIVQVAGFSKIERIACARRRRH